MAAEKSTNDQSDLENVSSTTAPKVFVRPMELGEEKGANFNARQPAKESVMHVAEYQHRLHESKRIQHTTAIGAPGSYDERHPSQDVRATTTATESTKQGNIPATAIGSSPSISRHTSCHVFT